MPKIPKTYCYVGIDPGASGGIAMLLSGGSILINPMPTTESETWDIFHSTRALDQRCHAVIEWIHPAIQGIGKSSMSKLYGNYMALRMALTAARIPFEVVQPKKWQQALGVSPRKKTENTYAWKSRLLSHAQQLFPQLPLFSQPKTEGKRRAICDALLIAEYCKRKHTGTL